MITKNQMCPGDRIFIFYEIASFSQKVVRLTCKKLNALLVQTCKLIRYIVGFSQKFWSEEIIKNDI